jgi:hypothetical protein
MNIDETSEYLSSNGYELEAAESGVFWYNKKAYQDKHKTITFEIIELSSKLYNGVIYWTNTDFYESVLKENGFMVTVEKQSKILFSTYGNETAKIVNEAFEEWKEENTQQ